MSKHLTLGIDATNLRQGGGRTHIIELLRHASPSAHGFSQVVVWGARDTLEQIDDRPWLAKRSPEALEAGFVRRTLWQAQELAREASCESCDVLFVPGGSFSTPFRPVVTMSRNLLPFEWREARRYGVSWMTAKMVLLRMTQSKSYRSADGVIFLTDYAQAVVRRIVGPMKGAAVVIPHGLNPRFAMPTKVQLPPEAYSEVVPLRILYVSTVDQYKHQWNVVEAVAALRERTGWHLALDLAGPVSEPAYGRLLRVMAMRDPARAWACYHGNVPYGALHDVYRRADLAVFASSCENMPNILLEKMAAGLPIAASEMGPMPEILRDAGVYFNPERSTDIAAALEALLSNPGRRAALAALGQQYAARYSWTRCADETFRYLSSIARPQGG